MQQGNIIKLETYGKITVISFLTASISGGSDVDEVAGDVRDYIDKEKPSKVIVDFTGVKFFSSQVLGMLVDIWKRLKKFDGRVIISAINPELSRVFKITNLDTLFDFYPDRQAALDAFASD